MDIRSAITIVEDQDDERPIGDKIEDIIAAMEPLASSLNVRLTLRPWVNYLSDPIGLEVNEFYAETPGSGAGSKIMTRLCQMADEAGVPLFTYPEGPRSKSFYERFGFERNPTVFSSLVRYPPLPQGWDE